MMRIGELSKRSGMSIRLLRRYEEMGLIYTAGRSAGNYRLFDEEALWCVGVIRGLRDLGLSEAEIRDLARVYLGRPDQPIGPLLAERLRAARERIDRRMAELSGLRRQIERFEAAHRDELAGHAGDFRGEDPRSGGA
jgi:MerR family transcriptional regulator, copper efflux regulator